MDTYRTTLKTARQGLDLDLFPMRLWEKAKTLGIWNPADVDLRPDAEDWQHLDDEERDLILRLTAQFQGGEESVAYDLLPLLQVMAREERIEEEMFLTSYLWEEAKHVDAFSRFLTEVTQARGDLEHYFTPAYRQIFFDEQPRAMQRLLSDPSPEALAEASVVYQMITEGVLAETGYHAYYTVLDRVGIMPGMKALIHNIQRDESRHVAYGVFLLSRLVAEHGDALWSVIDAQMNRLVLVAIQHIGQSLAPYGEAIPFGLDVDEFVDFGTAQFNKRYQRIQKARTQSLEEVLYGRSAASEAPA
ncbi:MAG: R2-like ligand-binding oxidase [Bacteroidetes bacterium]|jgi:ribonucleoside-diphosphate reductase beta chain|nr:R2-like ligand-binding oxidase [Bacteroidota bacterium]